MKNNNNSNYWIGYSMVLKTKRIMKTEKQILQSIYDSPSFQEWIKEMEQRDFYDLINSDTATTIYKLDYETKEDYTT